MQPKKKRRNVREKWVSGYVGGSEDGAKGFAIANSDFTSRWLVGGDEKKKKKKKKKKKMFVQKFFHIDPVGCPRLSISRLVHKSTHSQQ